MTDPNRPPAFRHDAASARTAWSFWHISVFWRRGDSRSGASVSTLTRAEVLGLETRLRALSGHPAPIPATVRSPS